jgi:hypothetical protein
MNKEFDSNFFDDASKCWKKNKIKLKNGEYAYKCCGITKKNTRCIRKVYNSTNASANATDKHKYDIFQTWFFCKVHINTKYDEKIHNIS